MSVANPVLYSQVQGWLEWEYCVLKPVVYSKDCSVHLPSILERLETVFGAGDQEWLIGDTPTVADVVIFATLFPLKEQEYLPGIIKAYMNRLALLEPFNKGIKKVRTEPITLEMES